MIVEFPYKETPVLEISDNIKVDIIAPVSKPPGKIDSQGIVSAALMNPIGTPPLRALAKGKSEVLIVFDDYSRPTPIYDFIDLVLNELDAAGIRDNMITFIAALGTHRPMTHKELCLKLGKRVVDRFAVLNHDWSDESQLEYVGDTDQGAPVWINRIVGKSDLVIALGAIMPLEVAGFTGGGKALVPGLSGELTVNEMHWTRIDVPSHQVVGKHNNPVRASINAVARKAGLNFIVNVILDEQNKIVDAVSGDMVAAHRVGCERAAPLFAVQVDTLYDVVIADSYPFDVEFWQANKALDTAGAFVRPGGTIILVSPCTEGWSRTHSAAILKYGYPRIAVVKDLVRSGKIRHKVVGVHMYQVAEAIVEKGQLVLVSTGIPNNEIEKVGFQWAETPQDAFDKAFLNLGADADAKADITVAVLKNSARIMALTGEI